MRLCFQWRGGGFLRLAFGVALAWTCLQSFGVTVGWENVNLDRREFPLARVVWSAPSDGFRVEKLEGAEGSVRFEDGRIVRDERIRRV